MLSSITTRNYWDSVNDYKPLMHTWYLGVLIQFYLVFPLITLALNRLSRLLKKSSENVICWGYIFFTVISFGLFLLPEVTTGDRFYLLPFRFYELMLGGIVGVKLSGMSKKQYLSPKARNWIARGSVLAIVGILLIGVLTFDPTGMGTENIVIGAGARASELLLPNSILVPLVVFFTAAFLAVGGEEVWFSRTRMLPALGKRSYSIFIWHQILLALYRYSISTKITIGFAVAFVAVLCVLSELSFRFLEMKITSRQGPVAVISAVLICVFCGYVYMQAGVIRDVPELGISTHNAYRSMHAEYCDRVYAYDQDFETTDKLKVLVVGNSLARDFGNVLLESEYCADIELSYSFDFSEDLIGRIKQADRIFLFFAKDAVPNYLWTNAKSDDIVYGIGTKNFGSNNGQIYFDHLKADYFEKTVPLDPGYRDLNEHLRTQWGSQYIDMIEVVLHNDQIRVFTDDKMYISQDTRHLTQAGAQYYARLLPMEDLLCEVTEG